MKANELRIGNCITFEKELIKVNFITAVSIGWGNSNFAPIILKDAFKPIPLTEEWLIKFGFEKVSKDIDGYYIWIIDHITICSQNKGYDYNDLTNIQHVHQLQNLYFALTQKELES